MSTSEFDLQALDAMVERGDYAGAWQKAKRLAAGGDAVARDRLARWTAFRSPLMLEWLRASVGMDATEAEDVWKGVEAAVGVVDPPGWLAKLWSDFFFREEAHREMLARARAMVELAGVTARMRWGDGTAEQWPPLQRTIQQLTTVCVQEPDSASLAEVSRRLSEPDLPHRPPPSPADRLAPLFRHCRQSVAGQKADRAWQVAWALDLVRELGGSGSGRRASARAQGNEGGL